MRKKLYKWHSLSALIALVPILIVSITGSILVFKVEIDTWLMPNKMTVKVDGTAQRLSLDVLIDKVNTDKDKM